MRFRRRFRRRAMAANGRCAEEHTTSRGSENVCHSSCQAFNRLPRPKTPPLPLEQPTITTVVEGPVTGQLKVKFRSVQKALTYVLRHAPVPNGGGMPASWTEQILTSS